MNWNCLRFSLSIKLLNGPPGGALVCPRCVGRELNPRGSNIQASDHSATYSSESSTRLIYCKVCSLNCPYLSRILNIFYKQNKFFFCLFFGQIFVKSKIYYSFFVIIIVPCFKFLLLIAWYIPYIYDGHLV